MATSALLALFTRDLRRWAPAPSKLDLATVNLVFSWILWLVGISCGLLSYFVWSVSIGKYLAIANSDLSGEPRVQWSDAFSTILGSGGSLILGVSVLSWLVMWPLWNSLRNYVCQIVEFENLPADERAKRDLRDQPGFRQLEALHDPPGDIFTLVGIACTFVGLAVSLMTIPSDTIGQLYGLPADDSGLAPALGNGLPKQIAAAAVTFGLSLAIGLTGSLCGILLSVAARVLAARFISVVKSSSELSDDFHAMAHELKVIRDVLTGVTDEAASAAGGKRVLALRVVATPPPKPPAKRQARARGDTRAAAQPDQKRNGRRSNKP